MNHNHTRSRTKQDQIAEFEGRDDLASLTADEILQRVGTLDRASLCI